MVDQLFRCKLGILCMPDEINGFLIGANIPELAGVSNETLKPLSEDSRHRKPG